MTKCRQETMELNKFKSRSESIWSNLAGHEVTDANHGRSQSAEPTAADDGIRDRARETSSSLISSSAVPSESVAEEKSEAGVEPAANVNCQTETDHNKDSATNQTTVDTTQSWKQEILLRLQRALVVSLLLFFLVPIVGCPALVFYLRARRAVISGDQGVAIRSERILLYLIASGGVLLGLGLVAGIIVACLAEDARLNRDDVSRDGQLATSTTIDLEASLVFMKSLLTRDYKAKMLCMSQYAESQSERKTIRPPGEHVPLQHPIDFLLGNRLQLDSEC